MILYTALGIMNSFEISVIYILRLSDVMYHQGNVLGISFLPLSEKKIYCAEL